MADGTDTEMGLQQHQQQAEDVGAASQPKVTNEKSGEDEPKPQQQAPRRRSSGRIQKLSIEREIEMKRRAEEQEAARLEELRKKKIRQDERKRRQEEKKLQMERKASERAAKKRKSQPRRTGPPCVTLVAVVDDETAKRAGALLSSPHFPVVWFFLEEFGDLCRLPKMTLAEMESNLNAEYPALPFRQFLTLLLKKLGMSHANENNWENSLWRYMTRKSQEEIPEELLALFYEYGYLTDPNAPEVDPEAFLTGEEVTPPPTEKPLYWEHIGVLLRAKLLRRLCEFQFHENDHFVKLRDSHAQDKMNSKRNPLRLECFAEDSEGKQYFMMEDHEGFRFCCSEACKPHEGRGQPSIRDEDGPKWKTLATNEDTLRTLLEQLKLAEHETDKEFLSKVMDFVEGLHLKQKQRNRQRRRQATQMKQLGVNADIMESWTSGRSKRERKVVDYAGREYDKQFEEINNVRRTSRRSQEKALSAPAPASRTTSRRARAEARERTSIQQQLSSDMEETAASTNLVDAEPLRELDVENGTEMEVENVPSEQMNGFTDVDGERSAIIPREENGVEHNGEGLPNLEEPPGNACGEGDGEDSPNLAEASDDIRGGDEGQAFQNTAESSEVNAKLW